MNNKITLVTATGNRPEAFSQCEKYMSRQTVPFDQWIVVDDGSEPIRAKLGQRVLREVPLRNGKESFRRNMLTLLTLAKDGIVFFIEDDDWYRKDHIEVLLRGLEDGQGISGQGRAKYYHLPHRRYKINPNRKHASLCQTALQGEAAINVALRMLSRPNPQFLDLKLWRNKAPSLAHRTLTQSSSTLVGIKGVPGRRGLGSPHGKSSRELANRGFRADPDLKQLEAWVGEDIEVYRDWSTKYA